MEDFADMEREYVMRSWSYQKDVKVNLVEKAEGIYFWNKLGKKYMDFSSQLLSTSCGHNVKEINEEIINQLNKYSYVGLLLGNEKRARLAKMIAEITGPNFKKTFFSSSGTEANEAAVKAAKWYSGKFKIISRYHSYHGATGIPMMLTGDPRRYLNEPGYPGVLHAPDCYCYRCPFKLEYPKCDVLCARYIGDMIKYEGKSTVAGIIAEPIVGSNGIIPPVKEYFPMLREFCDQYNIVLIVDEVMTGYGRTGKWFAFEHYKFLPDIITSAKNLSGSYIPLGGTTYSKRISDYFEDHFFAEGHTYSGHPLACAAAIGTINYIKKNRLVENAAKTEKVMKKRLNDIKAEHRSIGDVRGKGLFWGIELVKNQKTKEPAATREDRFKQGHISIPAKVTAECIKNGIFFIQSGSTLLFGPPLNINKKEINEALDVVDKALEISDRQVIK